MFCPECGHRLVETAEPMQEEFKGEVFTVRGIKRAECPQCGEYVISAEECDRLDDALQEQYRELHGLLSPADILSIRKSHGWSQKELERMLGVATPTVSRWETGAVIQSKLADNLLRGIRDHRCLADDLVERAEIRPRATKSASVCVNMAALVDANRSIAMNARYTHE